MPKINNKFTEIIFCRLCKSEELYEFIDFGSVPLGNNLQETIELSQEVDSYDLKVMRCNQCNHFQLSLSVSPHLLYATNYTYLSGVGFSFVQHIKKYVSWVLSKTNLPNNSTVIDIGSNDGTCLKYFQDVGYDVCGVDPAQKPSDIANSNGIYTINNFFNNEVVLKIINKFGKVDIVTSQNTLAHISNLSSTFENIYKILKLGGFFVFEIGYFKRVLESKCFDTIYHEHFSYLSLHTVSRIFSSVGFDMVDIKRQSSIQGGSLRLLFTKNWLWHYRIATQAIFRK